MLQGVHPHGWRYPPNHPVPHQARGVNRSWPAVAVLHDLDVHVIRAALTLEVKPDVCVFLELARAMILAQLVDMDDAQDRDVQLAGRGSDALADGLQLARLVRVELLVRAHQ